MKPAAVGLLGGRGFTLVELAVVLAVIGLLVWTMSSSYLNLDDIADRQEAERRVGLARDALRAFALANARLPCPDGPADDGRENCGADIATGWLPYETLRMTEPPPALRARYGVYRPPGGGNADLSRALDRSGDGTIGPNDLVRGLNAAAGELFDSGRIHVTGDDGTMDCSAASSRHVAYFLVVPLADRDGDGSRFDGEHPGLCAYAPTTGAAHDRDDVVGAEGFASLAGWLKGQ